MPDKLWVGICLLCGDDILSGTGNNYDDPDAFCEDGTHNCIPGRILHEGGTMAYGSYVDQQKAAGVEYGTWDEILAVLLGDMSLT